MMYILSHTRNFKDLPLSFSLNTLWPSIRLGNYAMDPATAGFFVWGRLSDEASERYERTGKLNTEDLNSGQNLWIFYAAALGSTFKLARNAQRHLSRLFPNETARSRRHWKGGRVQEWKRYE